MPTPHIELQRLSQDSALLSLYTLDLTGIGGDTYNFCNYVSSTGGNLTFGSTTYMAIPIITAGWDFSSTGAPPRPTLSVSNVNKTLLSSVIALGDLVGGVLTRTRTFEKFLVGGATPDSSMFMGPDTYIIEKMMARNATIITFQLSSIIDRMGILLPRRQVLKDKGFPGVARTRIR